MQKIFDFFERSLNLPLLFSEQIIYTKVLTMSTIALILKIAFEIIRRFQKPHYSSNQNKNLAKTNKTQTPL